MKERLLEFLRVARGAGLAISTAESIAAFDAVALVGVEDRRVLKDTLRLVLAKSDDERDRFDEVFERFFTPGSSEPFEPGAEPPGSSQSLLDAIAGSELARILLARDGAALVRNLHLAASAARVDEVRLFTQIGALTRRILLELGIEAFDAAVSRLRASGRAEDAAAAKFFEIAREAIVQLARDIVERRLANRGPAEAERLHDRFLRDARLTNVDRRDVDRMRVLVRKMARRLVTRYGRLRKRARRGEFDMRKTLRRNVAFDGVPFDVVWKERKLRKPRLVVLCDVSGSVASLAGFLLLFVSALAGEVADVRSFAFSDTMLEVTEILARGTIDEAIAQVMQAIGFHSSSYGRSLDDFERGYMHLVDRKTSVVILGDGRTNYGDPRVDVVRRLRERAKRVVWLNPEARLSWGTGDSEMLRYAPYCHVAKTCNRLRDLEAVVDDLVRTAR